MFSGKSSELQRRLRRHELAGGTVLVLKFAADTRYDALVGATSVATHDGRARAAVPVSRLSDALALVAESRCVVVGIDEAQFFPDLPECAELWAAAGLRVIAAGLDATFLRTPFPAIASLLCRAERITKLSAVCACGSDAAFTLRTAASGGSDAAAASGELIGGAEAYKAVCRGCFAASSVEAPASPQAAMATQAFDAPAPGTPPVEESSTMPPPSPSAAAAKKQKSGVLARLSRLEVCDSPMGADGAEWLRSMR